MKKSTDKQKSISLIAIIILLIVGLICGIATGLSRKNRESVNSSIVNEKLIKIRYHQMKTLSKKKIRFFTQLRYIKITMKLE